MNEGTSILTELRAATSAAHRRLEASLDAVAQLSTGSGQRRLVPRYAAFHAAIDEAVTPWLSAMPDLDHDARRRAATVAQAAGRLGVKAAPHEPVRLRSVAEALGYLYVAEGSTLGGRLILRELTKCGAGTDALGFLDPYGADTGRRWQEYLRVLARETDEDPACRADAVRGGRAGFALAEAILCPDMAYADG